jgi:hypothetical protein
MRLVNSFAFILALSWCGSVQAQAVNLSAEQVRASCALRNSVVCEKEAARWVAQLNRSGMTPEQQDVQLGLLAGALVGDCSKVPAPRGGQPGPCPCSASVMAIFADALTDASRRTNFVNAASGAACRGIVPPRSIKIPRLSPS